jgi:hypothetical protein
MVRGRVCFVVTTHERAPRSGGFVMDNWRYDLSVHPAADLFPLMSEAELRELGEDIKKKWLTVTYYRHVRSGHRRRRGRN